MMEVEASDKVEPILTNLQASISIRDVEHQIIYREHNSEMPFLPKGGEVYVFHPKTEVESRDWVGDGHSIKRIVFEASTYDIWLKKKFNNGFEEITNSEFVEALLHHVSTEEKVEETTAETRLCPLCQRSQKDSNALSLHLTKKHSVHPACLNNLLITAPYANRVCSSRTGDFSPQNINSTSQQKSSENTRSPLMAVHQDGSSQENDAYDESGVGNQAISFGDTEALVKDDKSNDKSSGAADGNVNHLFKCYACREFFTHKSALSVHYNSATHIQKIRTGVGNDCDSSTPVLAYPYVSTKPYQCDVCHVSYFYAFGLESHLKSVLHQSRTRKAGITATNSKIKTETGVVVANLTGTTVVNATQLANCNCGTQAEKLQVQPASSLLPTPVVSAQAVPTVLPLLTLAPNSVPHAIVPSVFPPPGTSTTPLIPQTQMLMPLIMNGLQPQHPSPEGPQQILQQATPVLGLCSAQHAQELGSSQSHLAATRVSSASLIPLQMNTTVEGAGVKIEIKEEPCDQESSQMTPSTADAITQVGLKEECNSTWDGIENSRVCSDEHQSKAKGVRVEENSKKQFSDANKTSTSQNLKSSHLTNSSPAKWNPSHANTVLIPSSTKVCSRLSPGPPVLTEFQSQVLWAFLESRNEADSVIPPREDCEALGKEVGLTEDEVQKWLVDTHCTKNRHHADVRSHYEGQGSSEEDEDGLMIDESAGVVLRSTTDFLSDEEDVDYEHTTVDNKRKRGMNEGDSEEESGGAKCQFLPSFRTS